MRPTHGWSSRGRKFLSGKNSFIPTPDGTRKISGPSPVDSFALSTLEYWSSGVGWNSTLMPVSFVSWSARVLSMSLLQLADVAILSVTSLLGWAGAAVGAAAARGCGGGRSGNRCCCWRHATGKHDDDEQQHGQNDMFSLHGSSSVTCHGMNRNCLLLYGKPACLKMNYSGFLRWT